MNSSTETYIESPVDEHLSSLSDPLASTIQPRRMFLDRSPASTSMSSAIDVTSAGASKRYFHSRRIKKEEISKPWIGKKDPREKWVRIIPAIGLLIGLAIAGFLIWDGLASVHHHVYCPVLMEDWSNGFNTDIWTMEAEVGGFSNGEFEQTTTTGENVKVENGALYIIPTLQDAQLINTNNTINLTAQGICSSDVWYNCIATTNTTNGTIVPPVKSGRINTKKGATIKYGRIEVTAQLPTGDWLWPAIWMLPVDYAYGPWPESGEVDIMESRGNNYTYPLGGNNIVSSTLHWGPDPANDAFWRTNNKRTSLHAPYSAGIHTFGMEWSEKYIFTYVDSQLLQVLYVTFDTPLWTRGNFPLTNSTGSAMVDPWAGPGTSDSTPFDQDFYLIINLAVGGTNGWFQDGVAGKPWVDASPSAKLEFWESQNEWYPTWQNGGAMVIHSVNIWQQKGYNGC